MITNWFTRIEYNRTVPVSEFAWTVKSAIEEYKLVHVVEVEPHTDLCAFYDVIIDTIGRNILFGEDPLTGKKTGTRWIEVRYDSRYPNAYRHTSNPQPLHTDCSYFADPANVALMYCVKQASCGGETIFLEADTLIERLQAEDVKFYRKLTEIPILFSKADDAKRRPVITFDEKGPVLTWNYYCVDPSEPESHKQLMEQFHEFLQEQVFYSSAPVKVRLNPGEAVLWQDERLLHGRFGFEAHQRNDRFFWKTGFCLR